MPSFQIDYKSMVPRNDPQDDYPFKMCVSKCLKGAGGKGPEESYAADADSSELFKGCRTFLGSEKEKQKTPSLLLA